MPYNVLIVDDEIHIRRLIEVNLKNNNYNTDQAGDGEEALVKIQANRPDLVILDVMMPKKDGFETLQALMSNPQTADIPVIMLTAKAQDVDVFKGWSSGVAAYLTKPFNPKELLTFVERVLSASNDPVYSNIETHEI